MIYYAGWLFLVTISVLVSLVAFIWGLRTGQFSDQERARYLPLGKDLLTEPIPSVSPMKSRVHTIVLCMIGAMGLVVFAAAFAVVLYHR